MEDNNTNEELNQDENKQSQSIPPIPQIGSTDSISSASTESLSNEGDLENTGIYSTEIPSVPSPAFQFESSLDLGFVKEKVESAREEAKAFIIGQEEMIDLLLIGIFTNGHILLEGVPGIAKTLSAKVLSKCLDTDFSRIQFTPDLMPSDILGTSVFNMKTSEFSFNKGPIFSNIILIDEGQFFTDLMEVLYLVNTLNKHVFIFGLDGDFKRNRFGQILDLIPHCDTVEKLTAVCNECSKTAIFSHRTNESSEQMLIGSQDVYQPLCRVCYNSKQNP